MAVRKGTFVVDAEASPVNAVVLTTHDFNAFYETRRALEAKDWPGLIGLHVDRSGFVQMMEGVPPDLLALLGQIPPEATDRFPQLHLMCAAGRIAAGDPLGARRHLIALPWAATVLAGARRTAVELTWLLLSAAVAQARGDVTDLLALSEQTSVLLGNAPLATEQLLPLRAAALQHAATAQMWTGALQEAADTAQRGADAAAEADLRGLLLRCVGVVAEVATLRGQLAAVERCTEFLAMSRPPASDWTRQPQSHALHMATAHVAIHRAEFVRAAEALDRARGVVGVSSDLPGHVKTVLAEVRLAVAVGDGGRAAELLDVCPELPTRGVFVDQQQASYEARVRTALGEPAAALRRLSTWHAAESGAQVLLARAQALLALDRAAEAVDETEQLRAVGMAGQPGPAVEAWLIAAAALSGQPARDALRQALLLATGERIRLPFLELTPWLGEVLLANQDLAEQVADLTVLERWLARRQPAPSIASVSLTPQRLSLIDGLTLRERDVLALLPSLSTTDEIARTLYVTPNTVKTHLKSLYRKLGVGTRREAVRAAGKLGLLPAVRPHPVRNLTTDPRP